MRLSAKDIALLKILEETPRASVSEIATRSSIPETTCRRRIEALFADKHVTLRLNVESPSSRWNEAGYFFLFLEETTDDARLETGQALVAMDNVVSCDLVEGDFDFIVKVEASNKKDMFRVRAEISNLGHVKRVVSHNIVDSIKEFRRPLAALSVRSGSARTTQNE